MDLEALEQKILLLLRDIEKLSDVDKKNHIVRFIRNEIERETSDLYLDKNDLTNIESAAVSAWQQVPTNRYMKGQLLNANQIRLIAHIEAIVACLRRYNIVCRNVKIKYDPER